MSASVSDREREWQLAPRELESVRRWLREHPRLDHLRIEPRSTTAMHDSYLDTEAWSILRAGFTLRVRRHDKGAEATLKSVNGARDGFIERIERTQPLASASVDRLATDDGPVASKVKALAGPDPLGVLFEVWTRRERFDVLADNGTVAEIALDGSRLGRADGPEPTTLMRVEIEAQGDGHPELPALVEHLRSECKLEPAAMTKFEAGLAAAGLKPAERAQAAPELTPHMSAAEAAGAVLGSQLEVFHRLEAVVRERDDVEALHDLRLATRRIAVSLANFDEHLPARTGRLRATLRKVRRALGEVRECDVLLADIEAFANGLDLHRRQQLAPLRQRLSSERLRARKRTFEALNAQTTRHMLTRLTELAAAPGVLQRPRPLAEVAPRVLRRRYRALRKAFRKIGDQPSAEALHQTRIAAKKLRYSLESFVGMYGDAAEGCFRAVRRIHNLLGEHQDAHVMALRLDAFAGAARPKLPGETLFLMGQLTERASQRALPSRKRLAKAMRRVRGRRWKALRKVMFDLREKHDQKATGAAAPGAPETPAAPAAA